jgi:DNA-directed RNA polymerase subunit RPC12/RpoP
LHGWFKFLLVAALMVGALAEVWADTPFDHEFRLGVLALLFASIITLFYLGFRCPRCAHSLLRSISLVRTGQPVSCPKCGTSVDEKR